jgi:uncharacterized membrane protein
MESGWDPEVSKFFRRILNSVSLVLIWMIACATAGIYNELAFPGKSPVAYVIIFYVCAVVSLFFLLRYLIKAWK